MKGIEKGDKVYYRSLRNSSTGKGEVWKIYDPFNSEASAEIKLEREGYFSSKDIRLKQLISVECPCGSQKLYHDRREEYFCPFCNP